MTPKTHRSVAKERGKHLEALLLSSDRLVKPSILEDAASLDEGPYCCNRCPLGVRHLLASLAPRWWLRLHLELAIILPVLPVAAPLPTKFPIEVLPRSPPIDRFVRANLFEMC